MHLRRFPSVFGPCIHPTAQLRLVFEAARFSWGEKGAELEVVRASLAASQLGTELVPTGTEARTTEALSQCRRAQRPVLLKLCHSYGVPISLIHE